MESFDCSFTRFLSSLELKRYKIHFCRVPNKPFIYVKTNGLSDIGLNEVFTISRSPYVEDAELLIRYIVQRLMETGQEVGVRKDLIRHPKTNTPLRYLLKLSQEVDELERRFLLVIGPDENNRLPGEKGYIRFL